ncbi:MAG: hypothetical protein ACLP6E_16295, partial [Acidimicrobiales bacterium]
RTYDDGRIACTDSGLVIRVYYPWGGSKRIPYDRIQSVQRRRMMGAFSGRGRIWGSGDFKHWFNLDAKRPKKDWALVIDAGDRILPVITPDDVDKVVAVLREHSVQVEED